MIRLICISLIAICFTWSSVSAADEAAFSAIELNPVARNLNSPTHITSDGTSRMFICEQAGTIRLMIDGALQNQPYLDIVKNVRSGGECGLLSVAFHPKFARNGRLFVNYTAPNPKLHTVISEFTTDPLSTSVRASTERIILTIDQPWANHNGGQIVFGPDGMLYIGMGDGGAGGDPRNNAQNPQSLLGKILCIDVSGTEGYAVPKSNPFVTDKHFRPEIWAWGLRNPWRFSFDRVTGEIYAGDVGQNQWEEIDILEKGGNYGWRVREGLHEFFRRDPAIKDAIDPIAEYGRDLGQSVTGGFVYRGKKYPQMHGAYFFGDYASGRIWALRTKNGKVIWKTELNVTCNGMPNRRNKIAPSTFGEDIDGELNVADHGRGVIYRIDLLK